MLFSASVGGYKHTPFYCKHCQSYILALLAFWICPWLGIGSGVGVVWFGVAWCGVVWCGVVWCGVVCIIVYNFSIWFKTLRVRFALLQIT